MVDHRDPHSFPTRRSSDLGHPPVRRQRSPTLAPGCPPRRHNPPAQASPHTHPPHAISSAPPSLGTRAQFRTHQDRKSTRLNSSHVKISYAVFRLKKKK